MTPAHAIIAPRAEQAFIVHSGGASWALPARRIETVFRVAAITPIPLAPPVIAGLVNLRGRVVVAIDLTLRLLGARHDEKAPPRIGVAVTHGESAIALLVEGAGDVVAIDDCGRIAPPAHMPADIARLTAAWFRTAAGILPLLDIDRLVEIECDRRGGLDRRAVTSSSGAKP